MYRTRILGALIAVAAFVASISINRAYASTQANYYCTLGTCEEATGCSGGCASYCTSSTAGLWCSARPEYGCGVIALKECGKVKVNGYCSNGVCVGGYYPNPLQDCLLQKCDSSYPPP